MKASSRASSLKPVLAANILNLAVYSLAIMPGVIVGMCHPFSIQVIKGPLNAFQEFCKGGESGCVGQYQISLVCCPDLNHPSTHEQKCIQDLHPLVCKHVELHGDGDADRLDDLFCFVPASIGTLQLSCSGTPRWASGSQSDDRHGLGCGI